VNAIKEGIAKVKDCQLVFVILSSNSPEVYNAVKRTCNIEHAIPSQCFLAKHCNNQNGINSIMTKVLIQMNAKLGGVPWTVKNPFAQSVSFIKIVRNFQNLFTCLHDDLILFLQKTLVVGFDVHHSGKGKNAVSVGAMVATTNDTFSSFYSTVSILNEQSPLSTRMCVDFGSE